MVSQINRSVKKTKEADKPRYIRAPDFQSGPEKDAALLKLLGAGS